MISFLISLIGKVPVSVKQRISNVIGIASKKLDSGWLAQVKTHLEQYPLSYTTIVGVLTSYAPEIFTSEEIESLDSETRAKIKKAMGKTGNIPPALLTGGDGVVGKVWGESTEDFSKSVEKIKNAKKVVTDAAYILGIEPKEVVALASLLHAIEPEFKELF